jgi:DNA-binding MarR family transcriptional regulator
MEVYNMAMDDCEAHLALVTMEGLLRAFQRVATEGELSLATASVLTRLAREGAQTITSLATAEGVSQPNMTRLIGRLERAGLARKAAGAVDRRTVLVEVTDAGMHVVETRRQQRVTALKKLILSMTEADAEIITAALPALDRLSRLMRSELTNPSRVDEALV